MAMTVGELVATFDVNTDPARQAILRAELQMRGLQQATDGSIRDMHGNYVSMARDLDNVANHTRRTGDSSRDAHAGLSALSMLSGPLSGIGTALGGAAQQAASAVAMFSAAAPAASGVVAALVNIVPAAAIAATALLAVAQAGAAIKIGTSGIGSALKAAFAGTAGAAGGAAGGVNKLADAQRAVRDAIAQAAVSNAAAARSVTSAERQLTDAQVAARQAQIALNQARQQAVRDLQDQNNALIDGQQSQRQAVLDLQDATTQLNKDKRAGYTASDEQMVRDQLAYDQAKQHLSEQTTAVSRLQSDTAAANKAGVNGSAGVVSAQNQLIKSQQAVRDQVQAVQLAQQAMARTAAQGLEAIQKAQEALRQTTAGAAGGANALAAAMAKLAPSAQAFVREVIALRPAWRALQLDVQQRLFLGLAGALASTATSVLPVLRSNLVSSAGAMNQMAVGVLAAARNLASSGVLGQAMGSASAGLHNLTAIPGQLVTEFAQLAAAAGPQFQRLTSAVASVASTVSGMLSRAFANGGLQQAINTAVSLIKEIGAIAGNVGGILMSVFRATSVSGGSFLDVLKTISGTLNTAFASPAVQSALKALFGTVQALATTAMPLLTSALSVIAPVLTALGPPVQLLISALGAGLQPIITALGPLLLAAAQTVGALLGAVSPLLPVAGQLIALLGAALTPIIAGVGTIFRQLTPLVTALAGALMTALGPILAQLPQIIGPLVNVITTLTGALLPVLTQLIVALSPSLGILAGSFAQILVALGPVIQQLAVLIGNGLSAMVPMITPIIAIVGQLATLLAGTLARYISGIVVPAINALTALLTGHFSQAWSFVKQGFLNWLSFLSSIFIDLPRKVYAWLAPLAGRLLEPFLNGFNGAINATRGWVGTILGWITSLPGRILNALGSLGSLLWNAGASIIQGLLHGLESGFDAVKNTLSNLTSLLPSWKGPPATDAKILTANGALVLKGFMVGIDSQVPALHAQLGGITSGLSGLTPGLLGGRGRVGGTTASAAGAAAAAPIHVHMSLGGRELGEIVIDPIRKIVKTQHGGSVQAAFGVPGRG